jgi:hypothetical protein
MRPFIFLLFLKVPIGFMNELLDVDGSAGAAMAASEPSRAGSITGNVVAIELQDGNGDSQYLLRVVTKGRNNQYILNANNPNCEDQPPMTCAHSLACETSLIHSIWRWVSLSCAKTFRHSLVRITTPAIGMSAMTCGLKKGAHPAGHAQQTRQGRRSQIHGLSDR